MISELRWTNADLVRFMGRSKKNETKNFLLSGSYIDVILPPPSVIYCELQSNFYENK